MIHNRLDYCNVLLAGIPDHLMTRLQFVLRAMYNVIITKIALIKCTFSAQNSLNVVCRPSSPPRTR